MRVLLMPSAFAPAIGGVEELSKNLACELQARGHSVEVWTHRHPSTLAERETVDGVVVRRFEFTLPRSTVTSVAAFLRGIGPSVRPMLSALRTFGPDVMHVQCFGAQGVYATALSSLVRVPLVVSLQGETVMDDHDIYEHSSLLRMGLRLGLAAADQVTGCSQFVLDDAGRFGLAPGVGHVIFNGVSESETVEPEPIPMTFDRFVLAYGRMVEKKGFDLLIQAFATIADRHPHLGLLIGGDGRARPVLQALIDELGLTARVLLPGSLSRGRVRWALERAAVVVVPSRVEPFGIVALEALRAGVPPVVSAHGGMGEFVRDGVDGIAVDPLDVDALAASITRLLEDQQLRTQMSVSGQERASAFSWKGLTADYELVYAEAVSSRSDSTRRITISNVRPRLADMLRRK